MVMITLYVRQQKTHKCIEWTFRLCGRGRGRGMIWENGTETCILSQETNRQSMSDTGYRMPGTGARG